MHPDLDARNPEDEQGRVVFTAESRPVIHFLSFIFIRRKHYVLAVSISLTLAERTKNEQTETYS